MATFDSEQQEQLDQVKHFWKQYGNLITWGLVLVLAAYAAWTGYLYWQQQRAEGAAGLYEEMDRAAQSGQADKVRQAFLDLKDQYAGTTYAEQGALLAARMAVESAQEERVRETLQWLVDHGKNPDLVAIARLRLAGAQLDAKQHDEALKTLEAKLPDEFTALADDRRGDILQAQGKTDEAVKAYQAAWQAMDPTVEYRRLIEGKLTALGHAPQSSPVPPAAS
ncbi:tetratricopeptide repeat protein [Aquabacterium sp. A3]|uniref:YfgM family protein n=1 Tax=Aquabacterium sp. A3 TaxID=3132829 RepID=UPI003119EA2C